MEQDFAARLVETANALGMNPVDLATIISYETAGTFDPTKRGPTTQWGQHRGLIQFGEPQAKQYGVDWNDPLGSQLGPEGAIVKYFTENGWRPGMGMMDAYSIVNAGAPGRYNASDANNGGAPGTVADKVNNQMGGHREKALALLDGTTISGPAGMPVPVSASARATPTGMATGPAAAPPSIMPVNPQSTEKPKTMWDALAEIGAGMTAPQQQAQAPQMMPMQRTAYVAPERDTIDPYLKFFASLR
jgi:hypothetical protein